MNKDIIIAFDDKIKNSIFKISYFYSNNAQKAISIIFNFHGYVINRKKIIVKRYKILGNIY